MRIINFVVRSQIFFDDLSKGWVIKCSKDSFLFCNQVYEAMKEQVFFGIESYMARKKVEKYNCWSQTTHPCTRSSKEGTLVNWRFWPRTRTTLTRIRSKFDLVHHSSTSLKPYLSRPTQKPRYCVILILPNQWLTMSSPVDLALALIRGDRGLAANESRRQTTSILSQRGLT